MNEIQNFFRLIENFYLENNGSKNYEDYIKHLKLYNLEILNISAKDIEYLILKMEDINKEILNKEKILPFDFNVHEIFLEKNNKYEFLLTFMEKKLDIKVEELNILKDYTKILESRLSQVFSYAIEKNCSIMIDAEQSYLQHYFDYFSAHVFKIYNKKNSILSATLQCYLNSQMQRLDKLHKFCREYNLKIGIKLVRGAYMNEENQLAKENGYPTPICKSAEETHDNYNKSLARLFEFLEEDEKVIKLSMIHLLFYFIYLN